MVVVNVDSEESGVLYPHKLLISRPDQHVAWRGDRTPSDPMALIDRLMGASAEA
jgi:hypothetical protein